jgi:tetratricopeptide (TPR) repeat protein
MPDSQAITAPQAFPKIPPSQPQPPQPATAQPQPPAFPMQPQPSSAPSAFDQPSPFAKPATAPMQSPQPSQPPQQPQPQPSQPFPQSKPVQPQLQSPEGAGNKGWTLADLDSIGSPAAAQPAPSPGPQAPRGGAQQQQVMDDLDRALTGQSAAPHAEAPETAGEAAAKPTSTGSKSTASRIRPISKQDEELKELVNKTTAPMDRKAFLADGPRQVMSTEQRKKFELTAIAGGIVGVGLFLALGQQVFNIVTGSQKYNTGVRALKSGDNVLAQVEMTAAIKLNGNANSLLYRAIAETRLGRLEKAMEDYNTILRINPKNQLALAGRAGLFLKQKKYDDVIIDADRMLKNKADDADGLRLRALALAAKGDYKRAADDATNCLAVMSQDEAFDAQRAVVLSTRAYCYFKVNKFDEAIADYSKAIECDKANVHLYSSRATTYKCVKAWKKALDDAEMAIKLDPGDNTLYKLRGQCYSGAGEALKAAEDLDTAVKIKPTLESFFARGEARLAAKDFSGAMEDFEYCLTVNPNNRVAKAKYDEARKNLYDSALHRNEKPAKPAPNKA